MQLRKYYAHNGLTGIKVFLRFLSMHDHHCHFNYNHGTLVKHHGNVPTAFRSKHGQVLSPDGHWQEIKASICEVPSAGSTICRGMLHKEGHHSELGWFGNYHKLPSGYIMFI